MAIPAAALITSGVLHGVGSLYRPPVELFGALAFLAAIAESAGLNVPQVRRRVIPANLARGHISYGLAFGFALGTGVLTRIASAGLFVVLGWAVVATTWSSVLPVALAYGVARALPIAFVAATVRELGTAQYFTTQLQILRFGLRIPEIVLLTVVGTLSFLELA